ncbi:hypothetical protein SO694_00031232 [Aureococcus anophagefferens]|uniref:Uncharacterized protein n=1 Tax=Aureococcus anophagefferens TaxID=44056 RepID=A0ABR1FJL7_AURAN
MEHLNPVTGSPLRVGPHGGDMQPRAYGSSVDAEYFDARQLETEVLSHNAQVIRERERPTAESEEEVLEWTGRGRRPSANGRGSKLGDIISYDGGRAGRSTREDAPANLRRDGGVTRDQLRRRDDVYGAPARPSSGSRPGPRRGATRGPRRRRGATSRPTGRARAVAARAAARRRSGRRAGRADPSPSAYDPPRAKNDSIARHLQDALAAALRENERLDGDLKAALAEVERYRRRFGPLPP